ncbi:hypothetical protein [Acuticoccus kandeliae]|uniref:hypothetical protein n=1 Tax=Acuticoccus kandeliae TaxID=2073160 RepID=UPI000D3E4720|nr:hypothetical protein [Acuticoccus kandeliae]
MAPRFGQVLPYIPCVSWPRSGHHLLTRLLRSSLGNRFKYCEFYGARNRLGSECCGIFPCRKPGVSMSKQHDLRLHEQLALDHPVIVQYRDFEHSVASHYELFIGKQAGLTDTRDEFVQFAKTKAADYAGFTAKWVHSDRPNRLTIEYDDLMADPVGYVVKIYGLYGLRADLPLIEHVVATVDHVTKRDGSTAITSRTGVKSLRNLEDFKWYDPDLFDELRAIANPARETADQAAHS